MPVTVLRAAIVVGAGGISWEMTRQLVKNLPGHGGAQVGRRPAPSRSRSTTWSATSPAWSAGEEAFGRVFEIGGPDQLTYVEMLQVAAEIINGRTGADRHGAGADPAAVVVLARRWSPTSTSPPARNLIDSMGTEVLVTDHSIQDVVPGEPLTYAEAVRRAVAEALTRATSARCRRRSAAAGTASRATRCTWVRIGPRMPPEARRCRPDHEAEQHRGEGQHHVAGGERRDRVGDAWCRHRVAGGGGVRRAAEEQLLGDAVDRVISTRSGHRALVGVVEHRADLAVEERDLAGPRARRPRRAPTSASPSRIGGSDGPARPVGAAIRPRCSGPEAKAPTVQTAARPNVAG